MHPVRIDRQCFLIRGERLDGLPGRLVKHSNSEQETLDQNRMLTQEHRVAVGANGLGEIPHFVVQLADDAQHAQLLAVQLQRAPKIAGGKAGIIGAIKRDLSHLIEQRNTLFYGNVERQALLKALEDLGEIAALQQQLLEFLKRLGVPRILLEQRAKLLAGGIKITEVILLDLGGHQATLKADALDPGAPGLKLAPARDLGPSTQARAEDLGQF